MSTITSRRDDSHDNPPDERKVRGRPPVPIDEELVERFLSVGMKPARVADYFNVTEKTIWNRFGNLIHQHKVLYDHRILEKQMELAMNGDGKMLVHLGKTMLTDRQVETAPIIADVEENGVKWVVEAPKPVDTLTESERQELETPEDDE